MENAGIVKKKYNLAVAGTGYVGLSIPHCSLSIIM